MIAGALLALVACAPAHAAFPGLNGKIAFDSGFPPSLMTMNPDGTGQTTLRAGFNPAWSPDGTKLAYIRATDNSYGNVYITPSDGSTESLIVAGAGIIHPVWYPDVAWSPDGTKLATTERECTDVCTRVVYVLNASPPPYYTGDSIDAGGEPTWSPYGGEIAYQRVFDSYDARGLWGHRPGQTDHQIWAVIRDQETGQTWPADDPDYSPTGAQILFSSNYPDGADYEIFTVPAAGGTPTPLTNNTTDDLYPAWSPDGTKIAFASGRDGNDEIYTMNADGTNQVRITNDPDRQGNPSWQPLPYPGYARPKGATPIRVSLVPAHAQCTSPNRTHGPPLAFGSCAPNVAESAQLTTGTPDLNGQATGMNASVRYETILGIPSTPADEADIALHVQITDVREQNTLADYAGEVEAQATARLTDRTASAGDPATTTNILFPLTTSCTPTADPNVGSTCSLTTTLDTLIPGAIEEGQRTVLQLSQVQVIDGGSDGDTATLPNTVFLRQGVFVP